MRRFLALLIALSLTAAGALVWATHRSAQMHEDAGPLKQRQAIDASGPTSEALSREAAAEGESPEQSLTPAGGARPRESPPAATFSYWGKLVDGETGRPIGGSAVRLRMGEAITLIWSDALGRIQITDADHVHQVVRVSATGFGPAFPVLASGFDDPAHPNVMVLWRAAAIDARVVDASGAPAAGVTVCASIVGRYVERPEGGYVQMQDVEWSAQTDADGRCAIEDLPGAPPITVVVRQGYEELYQAPAPLTLKPGERREWQCRIGGFARVSGVVLDEHESAVADQEIWLASEPRGPSSNRSYFDDSAHAVTQRATTDDAGRFSFARVADGEWRVGPAALLADAARSATAVCPATTAFTINAPDSEKEVVLHVQRGLYIRGRAVLPNGNPAAGASVRASYRDPGGFLEVVSDEDGAFTLGPMMSGEFGLTATGVSTPTTPTPIVARAGDENVVLMVSNAASVRLRAVDARSDEPCIAHFFCRAREPVQCIYIIDSHDASEGIDVSGLVEGTYDIAAQTADGRVGMARNVEVAIGVALPDVTVRMETGARLRVRFDGRTQATSFEVLSDGAMVTIGILKAGASKPVIVPAGPAVVRFLSRVGLLEERNVNAVAGEEVDVVFHRD